MMSAEPTPIIAALDIKPTYSVREAAALLGRSYSWLDQRVRKDQFVQPDGTVATYPRRLPAIHPRHAGRHRPKQLQKPLVLDGQPEVHLPRAAHCRPPRDRRVQDPELSFLSHGQFVAG